MEDTLMNSRSGSVLKAEGKKETPPININKSNIVHSFISWNVAQLSSIINTRSRICATFAHLQLPAPE